MQSSGEKKEKGREVRPARHKRKDAPGSNSVRVGPPCAPLLSRELLSPPSSRAHRGCKKNPIDVQNQCTKYISSCLSFPLMIPFIHSWVFSGLLAALPQMTSIYSPSLSSFFLARSPSSPLSPPGVMVPDIEEGELPMGISCSPPTSSSNSEPRKGEALLPLPAPPLPPRGRDPYDLGHGAASHHSATHHVHRSSHRSSLAMEVVRGKIPPSPTATLSPPSTSSSTSSSPASCSSHLDENLQLSEFNWNDFEILQKVGEGTTGYDAASCLFPSLPSF